jgi:uncharacterized protein (DUF2147 family)
MSALSLASVSIGSGVQRYPGVCRNLPGRNDTAGKRLCVLTVYFILLMAMGAWAQDTPGDAVLGQWLTEGDKALVEIFRCENRYCGKIVWLKEPKNPDGSDVLDAENPDPSKRNRTVIGLNLVWGFRYDEGQGWVDGSIYDPDNGKTYSCKMNLEVDTLKVRGYVGISLFGRTTVWKRKQ